MQKHNFNQLLILCIFKLNVNDYYQKQITFKYKHKVYQFDLKVTNELVNIFKNYPVVDFETYFNIPLSKATSASLVPILKEISKKMPTKKEVDYLMHFTRYAFLYEDDELTFSKEKTFLSRANLVK